MNKKILVLHATEPECKTCLIGTWYDKPVEALKAIQRGEGCIHTIMTAGFDIEKLYDDGWTVHFVDVAGNISEAYEE